MSITITLIAQVLAFTILIWLVNKYMWGPLSEAMESRRSKIADGLAASEKGEENMRRSKERASEVIKGAKAEAAEIIAQAQARGGKIIEEAKAKSMEEADRLKAAANAEMEREINRAKDGLRTQVSELAVAGASKILGKEIDANTHKDVLDELVSKL